MQTQIRKKNLYGLNSAKKLLRRTRALNDHKRLLCHVAKSDVPNICVAIRVGLRNHRGVGGLLEKVVAAKEGLYKPKDFQRRDYDVARLLHCVGGDSAVTIASRALNLPSLRTIKRHSRSAPLEVSTGYPKPGEVGRNIDAMYPTKVSSTTSASGTVGISLMVDEISLEKRLRYDSRHNTILGLCREHSTGLSKEFNSMDDANAIWSALREKETHLATEATVAALGPLTGDGNSYVARAIHVSGSCKKETAAAHSRLLSTLYSSASTHPKLEGSQIYYIATDGEAKRGAALVPLTLSEELPVDSPIYDQLSDLPLFNTLCGPKGLTIDKDYKHLFKRFRTSLSSDRGIDILGELLTPDLVRRHLHDCGMSTKHSHALFNPNDPQDVPLACELMVEILRLPPPPPNASPGYARKRRAIQLLGKLYGNILQPYLTPSYTVREQLNDLFTAMHMMLIFYTESRGAFCPIQTYADFMHAGKNAAFCVAKIKIHMPDGSFYLILMGSDRLEFSFSRVRTLVPNDCNTDVFQCGGRLSTATEMTEILNEHPDWDRGSSRRLHLAPLDSNGQLSRNVDHISPKSWTGDVSVRNVSIRTAWRTGRQRAIELFSSYGYDAAATFRRLEDEGKDILHPLGRPVFKPELRGLDEVLEPTEVSRHRHNEPSCVDNYAGFR
ncbi:hypothetical protein AURDEDRAFT_70602 [Auricularia subglabra TFB-10046 SS5]|nr:hypothetical protein AURDEDRAFT_70602 [Auricularia subglabra TFB-10046 SS5]